MSRALPEAGLQLRERVLRSVHREIATARWGAWRYAAAVAATLMIGANLSIISASVTSFVPASRRTIHQTEQTARAIHQLEPELTAVEVRRMALLLETSGNLRILPAVRTGPGGAQ
jgi:hypothetical protein